MWVRFLQTVSSPESASAEERLRFARMANWIKYLGLVQLAFAPGFVVSGILERQSYGNPPADLIAIQDFDEQHLQGRLQEAKVQGILQFEHMQASLVVGGGLRTLIPFTEADWESKDPVHIFLQTHHFIYDQKLHPSGPHFERGLEHMGLPLDSQGPTQASVLVHQPKWPSTLPAASSDAILVTFAKETWRERVIEKEVDGIFDVAWIFGSMGLIFALFGFSTRRSILQHID